DTNGPPLGKWIFYNWDAEITIWDYQQFHTFPFDGYYNEGPGFMHNALHNNPDYNRLLGDRVHKHLLNNGALTSQKNIDRYQVRAEQIENAILGESARWGDFVQDFKDHNFPVLKPANWDYERDRFVNPSHPIEEGWIGPYFPNRTNWLISGGYPSRGFYPTVAAPTFSQHGGEIAAGASVTITGSGTIKYTTDGREPKDYGTTIASGGTVTINNSLTLKARAYYTSGAKWSALNEATFAVGPVKDKLRITELMYHPAEPNDPCQEYVELKNIGTTTLNLNLVKFTDGIGFTFPNMTVAAGDHVLVVKDTNGFVAKYGGGKNIAGKYTGALANGGEHIRFEDAIGRTILDFNYADNWQDVTDGEGFSLNIFDANAEPNTWGKPESWAASKYAGGTPDTDDTALLRERSIAINELLAHQDAAPEDWIELKNTTSASINIGGWYISDDEENLTKYQIKSGTVLGAGQYLVLTEDANFGSSSTDPGKLTAFAFSEYGETAYLTSSEGGQLTGYREKEDFDASENSVAFGRYLKSTGTYNFVAMSSNTPGSSNAYPKVGPVVINEIMYNPASRGQNEEYVELRNTTGGTVNLYDVNGIGWEFTDGIGFTFPAGTTIPANGYLLVVDTTPAYFKTKYSVPGGITVLGPYSGRLSNAGEKLELSKPTDTDELGQTVYVRVDRVVYSDGSHPADCPEGVDLWPKEPDGGGKSLSRKFPLSYGNDPNNWQAATPSPGAANP
ncbi:MAG: lamin tail domain-containing protein, partial [Sedimentisphaerales bacterium]|nr:lamin tail domain-containing protein [Sedimentisphaerales bacterium]